MKAEEVVGLALEWVILQFALLIEWIFGPYELGFRQ